MTTHPGGCLCGAVRYETLADPVRVTICHCRFCQRATGSAYMVEPIFRVEDLRVISGTPTVYDLRSAGSGKMVHVHFCQTCGTKIYLTFERFVETCGVYAGTFDNPDWFAINPGCAKHIFLDVARQDTILPAGIDVFVQHAMRNDGTPLEPIVFDAPHVVGRRSGSVVTDEP
jgi:hypothetical protein